MNKSNKNTEIELKLFNQIEKTKNHTQRSISKELNIALGLSNALIKKFLNKGFLKLSQAPMKRYFYYITPKGLVEKAKLTSEFLTSSFDFYNKIKDQYEKEFTYKLESQVDMIQFHLVAFAKIDKPDLQEREKTGITIDKTIKENRKVDFDEMGVHDSKIYDFDLLEPDMEFVGPAIVEDPSTTVVIFPDQKCKVDNYANLHISIEGENSE